MNATRLDITSVSGASHLFYQFNFSDEERGQGKDALRVLWVLLSHFSKCYYETKGTERFENKDFYNVGGAENCKGFCISVKWGGDISKDEALGIISDALSFVISYDTDNHTYANDETKNLVENNIEQVKQMAIDILKDIQNNALVSYKTEYWDPFD